MSKAYDTYRKLFTSASDGVVCWWYLGTAFVEVEGFPEVPVTQAETIMAYKTETLGPDSCKISWWEIGYFRDPITGQPSETWLNPITGQRVKAPQKFEEGPAYYTVTAKSDTVVEVDLVQAQAKVRSLTVEITEADGQVQILQTEVKVRGFPRADGSLPDPDSSDASAAETQLIMFGSRAELDGGADEAQGTGAYTFRLASPPAWMGFGDRKGSSLVRGVMHKAPVNEKLNPIAWDRLKAIFPDRFEGEEIRPVWG
ncbi:hypothetical protein [Phenylobacterium aquaticum]|uniref:hypothetical protein n=1 Tax=Phenylobacterium aquaticum TaxID=1763816 RepID=UPI0026EF2269|nr:hypothetical protein [Phenylobacterium aquaticum]